MEWHHKDIWTYRASTRTHVIEVVRWTDHHHRNRWNVYVYVYPAHPLFSRIDQAGYAKQAATAAMPLHGGPTSLRVHRRADGDVTSIEVGCDYSHLHDDQYYVAYTRDHAGQVFRDAEQLDAWMTQQLAEVL